MSRKNKRDIKSKDLIKTEEYKAKVSKEKKMLFFPWVVN